MNEVRLPPFDPTDQKSVVLYMVVRLVTSYFDYPGSRQPWEVGRFVESWLEPATQSPGEAVAAEFHRLYGEERENESP